MKTEKVYWPTLSTEELGPKLKEKVESSSDLYGLSMHNDRMREAARSYYGMAGDTPSYRLTDSGEAGEISLINVNFGRYLVQHMLSLVAGTTTVYNAIANNTDVKSRQQAQLANSLLNAYVRFLRLDRVFYNATESALVTGEGFVTVTWDARATDADGKPDAGDIVVESFTPFDVIRDLSSSNAKPVWYIVRRYVNRYDLIARFPEFEEEILNAEESYPSAAPMELQNPFYRLTTTTDFIPIYTFYHDRTPALPPGREVLFLPGGKILFSGALAYQHLPVYRMSPADIMGSPLGYTPYFDALSEIDAANALDSTILSNQFALGLQKVWSQKGDDLDVKILSSGLVNVQTNQPPQPLNLVQSANELFISKDAHRQSAMILMGLSETALGTNQQRMSGDALAILDQKTTQFATPLHESSLFLRESVGQAMFETLQTFAVKPRIARLVGKNNLYMLRSFSSEDLSEVNRVTIEMGDPSMKNYSVRIQMADKMSAQGLITTKEEYYSVATTGQIELESDGPVAERNLIQQENENLMVGIEQPVIDVDEHVLHILKHKCLLANPEVRQNPQLVTTALNHIQLHLDALRQTDPELLMILGQQPAQLNQQIQAQQAAAPDAVAPSPEEEIPTSAQDAVDETNPNVVS